MVRSKSEQTATAPTSTRFFAPPSGAPYPIAIGFVRGLTSSKRAAGVFTSDVDALMLDPNGLLAECSGENLFMIRGGKLYTSPRATILEGITRDSVITLAQDLGYQVIEEPISRDQLYIADEVFLTGTAAECVAVREIDFRTIGSGKMGPITRAIQKSFFQTARGEGQRSAEWLDYVEIKAKVLIF